MEKSLKQRGKIRPETAQGHIDWDQRRVDSLTDWLKERFKGSPSQLFGLLTTDNNGKDVSEHTRSFHLDVDDASICERSLTEFLDGLSKPVTERQTRYCASRFTNEAAMLLGTREALIHHSGTIARWLRTTDRPRLTISSRPSSQPIGVGVYTNEKTVQYRTACSTTLILSRQPRVKGQNDFGFCIVSAFPNIDHYSAMIEPRSTWKTQDLVMRTEIYRSVSDDMQRRLAVMSGIIRPGQELPHVPPLPDGHDGLLLAAGRA